MSTAPKHIHALISQGELAEALQALCAQAETAELTAPANKARTLLAKLSQVEEQSSLNTADYDDLERTRSRITQAALALVEEVHPPQNQKRKGLSEQGFKQQVLWLLVFTKLVLVLYLFTLWQSGGLLVDQFTGVIGMLLPVLVSYIGLFWKDDIRYRHAGAAPERTAYVKRSFQVKTWGLLLAYLLVLVTVITLRGTGTIPYPAMVAMLVGVESYLGVYVGQLVFGLFEKA